MLKHHVAAFKGLIILTFDSSKVLDKKKAEWYAFGLGHWYLADIYRDISKDNSLKN